MEVKYTNALFRHFCLFLHFSPSSRLYLRPEELDIAMIKHLPLVTLLTLFITSFPEAQTFTNLHNGFPSLEGAATAWSDYDGDEDLDLVIVGFSSVVAEVGSIYRNDGDGQFTLVKSLDFPVSNGAVNWGDYDHDGDPDLLVNGQGGLGSPLTVTTIYNNGGNDVFVPVASGLPGIMGIARWMDYDGDGWLDVIMGGIGNSFLEDSIRLFHNDTTGMFTEILIGLPGYFPSDISVVDFDVDGDLDFLVTGGTLSVSTFPVTRLFSNEGDGQFTQASFPFIDLSTGTSKWADYDYDGDPDLLYNGIDSTSLSITLLYRNDSTELFTLMDTNLQGSGEPGSVDWADVDGDGDLDILLGGPTALLRNDGNNFYTDITPVDFDQGVPCSFADFDQDGDQDVLIISSSGGLIASTIHRNELITDLHFSVPGDQWISIQLSPNPVSDEIFIPGGYYLQEVSTIQGQQIDAHQIGNTVYAHYWPAGMYVLWLASNDHKEVRVGRIIKQ